jgi:peptide/nickel transport system substrate-binding protein
MLRQISAASLLAASVALSGPAFAAAGDECVKVLGYEWSGEKQSMDPAIFTSSDDAYHLYGIYNRLVDVDENFNVLPELATEWKASDDGLTWTFKLRQGVKFHSGKDLTAKDVVYTFKRLIDPATASPAASTLAFLKPEGITAVDDHTVSFTTDSRVGLLPVLITTKFTLIIPDGTTTETLKSKGDGTGPFMQEQFTPNTPVRILRKNPSYWDAGKPAAECVKITVAQEAVAAATALKAGQVDLVLNVDPSVIDTLKDDPNIQLLSTGAGTSMTVSFWTDTAPFDNVKVRQAFKAAIDRQGLVDTVLRGFGEPAADNPVPVTSPASYVSEAPKQDIEKAKALLAEAGVATPVKFDLHTAEAIPGMNLMAQAVAEMVRPAGFEVNLVNVPAESFWDQVWLKKPFVMSGWSMRPPGEGLAVAYLQNAEWNETHWKRPEYDDMLAKANATIDEGERNALYKQVGQLLAEEGGVVIPMFTHQVVGLRKACSGYTPHAQNFNLDYTTITCGK